MSMLFARCFYCYPRLISQRPRLHIQRLRMLLHLPGARRFLQPLPLPFPLALLQLLRLCR
jgi:hypothetical protein